MNPTYQHAGNSDIGRERTRNEDRWIADPEMGLYMVIDGMGGRASGELAAEIIATTFPQQLREQIANIGELMDEATLQLIDLLLCNLNRSILSQTLGEPGLEGMGATVVVFLVRGMQALVAHLGDCRAYLLRQTELIQLTNDHTIVQLLLERGEIEPDEVDVHPARHQVTRFVGMDGKPLPDVRLIDLLPGDRVLLCSDGLTGMVDDLQMKELMTASTNPDSLCERLITAANDAGGSDNITSVVICFNDQLESSTS